MFNEISSMAPARLCNYYSQILCRSAQTASPSEPSSMSSCTPLDSTTSSQGLTETNMSQLLAETSSQGNDSCLGDYLSLFSSSLTKSVFLQGAGKLQESSDLVDIWRPIRWTEYHALFRQGLQQKWREYHRI